MKAATDHNKQSSEDQFQNPSRNSPSSIRVHDSHQKLLPSRKSSDIEISPTYSTTEGANSDTTNHASTYQLDDSHVQICEPNDVDDSNMADFDAGVEWNTTPQDFPSRREHTQHNYHSKTRSTSSVNSYSTRTQDTPVSPVWSYRERREWPLDSNNEFRLLQHYIDSLAPWVCIHESDVRSGVLTEISVRRCG